MAQPPKPLQDAAPEESVLCELPDWLIPTGRLAMQDHAPTTTYQPPSAGPAAPQATALPPAQRMVDRGVIARGGFGAIHKVFDKALLRTVAMKTLESAKGPTPQSMARFVEEAQITGQLDHPNIVPVHELGVEETGKQFFTMKLVAGETLTAIYKRAPEDSAGFGAHLNRVVEILLRVCDALAFAHSRGVVHRDLKPDNIMVGRFGQVYVMDWGIAQLMVGKRTAGHTVDPVHLARDAGSMDAPGTVVGTFAYMAPEQAYGHNDKIDARTDVFGLGAILYQALTGTPPYRGKTPLEKVMNAQAARITPPQQAVPGRQLPSALCQIALRAMRAAPQDRYQSISEFKEELERVRGGYWFATRVFPPGETVVQEGDGADAAYIIVDGTCDVFRVEAGRKVSLRTLGPGDVFGETAIFANRPRTATVVALTPLTVMVVTRESLEEQLAQQSWMGAFVRTLAARFQDQDQQAVTLRATAADAAVVHAALQFVAFHGQGVGNTRVAPWPPLLAQLQVQFGKAEEELAAALAQDSTLTLDRTSNSVVLTSFQPVKP